VEKLQQLGFSVKKREAAVETGMAATRDRCLRLLERYKQHHQIPDDVRIVSLQELPMHKVERFFRQFFGDDIGPMRLSLDQRLSLVILKGEEVIAAYTGYVQNDAWISPRLAVSEEYQNSWVTPMLVGYGAKAGFDSGLRKIRMYADEDTFPEMIRIGRRTGGKEVAQVWFMGLDLLAPWPELTAQTS
jgi:hypothetical protein